MILSCRDLNFIPVAFFGEQNFGELGANERSKQAARKFNDLLFFEAIIPRSHTGNRNESNYVSSPCCRPKPAPETGIRSDRESRALKLKYHLRRHPKRLSLRSSVSASKRLPCSYGRILHTPNNARAGVVIHTTMYAMQNARRIRIRPAFRNPTRYRERIEIANRSRLLVPSAFHATNIPSHCTSARRY